MRHRGTTNSSRNEAQKVPSNMSSDKDMQNTALYVIICILLLVIFLYCSGSINTQRSDKVMDENQISTIKNVILVLGIALSSDGTAPQSLKERAAMVVTVMSDYEFLSFDDTIYIISGSYGSAFVNQRFDHPTEAKVMHDILVNDHKIASNSIIMETNARDTIENFYYTFRLLRRIGINKLDALFIVTSDYHIKRCLQILNVLNTNGFGYFIDIGKVYDIGSKTEWDDEEQRIFRLGREAYTMYNSTQFWVELCQTKWYLHTGDWFVRDNTDVLFDKDCNMIEKSTNKLHQRFSD